MSVENAVDKTVVTAPIAADEAVVAKKVDAASELSDAELEAVSGGRRNI